MPEMDLSGGLHVMGRQVGDGESIVAHLRSAVGWLHNALALRQTA